MAVIIDGSNGITTNSNAVYNGLQTDTAKSATGTTVTFTGIPSWVKKVTIVGANLSSAGSADFVVRIGPSSGVVTTGYTSVSGTITGTNTTNTNDNTTSFYFASINAGSDISNGVAVLHNISGNTWIYSSVCCSNAVRARMSDGSITLSGTLSVISIIPTDGVTAFDAGTFNLFYE
jgi:hypothetical protein